MSGLFGPKSLDASFCALQLSTNIGVWGVYNDTLISQLPSSEEAVYLYMQPRDGVGNIN